MTNNILNEKKSALVNKLVAHWLSQTKGKPTKVQQLVDFLQQDKIQQAIPYNAEITDEVINTITSKASAKGFGKKGAKPTLDTDGDGKPDAVDADGDGKPDPAPKGGGGGGAKASPKQQQQYVERIKKVIDGLKPEEKTALARMLG